MRKQDKYKVIMEANMRLEKSYLRNKGLLNESEEIDKLKSLLGDKYDEFVGLVQALKKDPEAREEVEELSQDKNTLNKIEAVAGDMNEDEEEEVDKTPLQKTLFGAKYGAIAGSMTALPYLATIVATGGVATPAILAAAAMIAGGSAIGSVLTYLSDKGEGMEFKDVDSDGPFPNI